MLATTSPAARTSMATSRAYVAHAETRNDSLVGSKIAVPAPSPGGFVARLSPQPSHTAVAPARRRTSRRLGSLTPVILPPREDRTLGDRRPHDPRGGARRREPHRDPPPWLRRPRRRSRRSRAIPRAPRAVRVPRGAARALRNVRRRPRVVAARSRPTRARAPHRQAAGSQRRAPRGPRRRAATGLAPD